MAKAALEMAVLDAYLRSVDESLASYLGVRVSAVDAGAVVGLHPSTEALVEEVGALVAAGYRRVKVKVLPGRDVAPLTAIREAFPELALQADANGSYDRHRSRRLTGLDELGLVCLEQPLPPDDLIGHAELARRLDTPVCLDESLSSMARLSDAVELGACEVACLKPARLGGYLQAVQALEICTAAGIPAWCGGMFETGFARAANAAFAGLSGCTLPGDFSGGERFVEADPAGTVSVVDGRVSIYEGPGVGPAFDPEKLAAVTERLAWLPAR